MKWWENYKQIIFLKPSWIITALPQKLRNLEGCSRRGICLCIFIRESGAASRGEPGFILPFCLLRSCRAKQQFLHLNTFQWQRAQIKSNFSCPIPLSLNFFYTIQVKHLGRKPEVWHLIFRVHDLCGESEHRACHRRWESWRHLVWMSAKGDNTHASICSLKPHKKVCSMFWKTKPIRFLMG